MIKYFKILGYSNALHYHHCFCAVLDPFSHFQHSAVFWICSCPTKGNNQTSEDSHYSHGLLKQVILNIQVRKGGKRPR